jgi:hypothetical protein
MIDEGGRVGWSPNMTTSNKRAASNLIPLRRRSTISQYCEYFWLERKRYLYKVPKITFTQKETKGTRIGVPGKG